jgi:type II secretory pathway component PulL
MEICKWINSNIDYTRALVSSGLEGARAGAQTTLEGTPVASLLIQSVRESGMPMLIGAYIGALGAALGSRRRRASGLVLVSTLLGATIGLTTGMAWQTRRLTGGMARRARKNIDSVRDARWLAKHPIDYA